MPCFPPPHSLPPLPPPTLCAPYFLKVSVWEINDPSAAKDDSLHKDDIELISEMLQNWLFDVYRQTWIIKILLKNPWMADTRILFVMINLAQSLQWESSWSVSDKIAFHSPRWISLLFFFSSRSVRNSDLIGLSVLARRHTNTRTAGSSLLPIAERRGFVLKWDVPTKLPQFWQNDNLESLCRMARSRISRWIWC